MATAVPATDGSFDYDYQTYDQANLFPPRFSSVSGTHVVKEGNTTILPCVVQDLGPRTRWCENRAVSAFSDGYNLQISQARPADADVYTCSVALSDRDLEQTQTLDVQYGPFIRTVPESGLVIVEQGQNTTLECHASGNPKPRVKWRKKVQDGSKVVDLKGGELLRLDTVTRSDAGVFECLADNTAGDLKTAHVRLQVLYKPEVEVEKSTLYTGEGFTIQLVCFVHADPAPQVTWTRSSSPINQDHISEANDVVMTSRFVLTVSKVTLDDFDTYTCNATNQLGSSHGKIAVLGVADKVEVVSTPMDGDSESYDLAWKVKSYSPIIEYKIAYRKTKLNSTSRSPGRWKEVRVPTTGREPVDDIHFQQQVTLKKLTPATAYDLHIQAKNKHGWNRVSDTFHFSTIGRALESRSLPSSNSQRIRASISAVPIIGWYHHHHHGIVVMSVTCDMSE
ncbi:limbic system-associated membrane protein-like [Pollicipes pollicipes]|uniref:limbic system-associated membrane protein-like n=1 Tax=Pollicipes pollicipes TaxID=41117 RepID=UPI0018855168|nr:limbic system-associated membrane protein-like [Pollicipes pollicipes]